MASTTTSSTTDMDTAAAVAAAVASKEDIYSNLPPPHDRTFLEQLPDPLKEFALLAAATASEGADPSVAMDPSVAVDTLEINLRQEALSTIRRGGDYDKSSSNKIRMTLGEFWKGSLLLCWHMMFMLDTENDARFQDMGAVRKIPFLLLEDILESLTIQNAWNFFEQHVQPLFPILFGPQLWYNPAAPQQRLCWNPFLKLTNNFLKRLSLQPQQKYKDSIASLLLILSNVFPLTEKLRPTRPWGTFNEQASCVYEVRQDFEQEQQQHSEQQTPQQQKSEDDCDDEEEAKDIPDTIMYDNEVSDEDGEDDGAVPDYTAYESFWKLQQAFQRPNLADTGDFLQSVRSLFNTLETTPVKPGNQKNIAIAVGTAFTTSTHRYLTSSRLLSIQMKDANFRACILNQVMITCHHLKEAYPFPGLKSQLSVLQEKAFALLHKTLLLSSASAPTSADAGAGAVAPGHPNESDWLQTILSTSEESWRLWKKAKFTPDVDQRQSKPLVGRKRKRGLDGAKPLPLSSPSLLGRGEEEQQSAPSIQDLPAVSRQMRNAAPKLQKHLAEYVDALDPESGIEPDYHPKNDGLFCWRAMRLLSARHLPDMHLLPKNGDFETVVRTVYPRDYQVEIPGETPNQPTAEEEEEELKEDDELKKGNDDDEEENHEENEGESNNIEQETKSADQLPQNKEKMDVKMEDPEDDEGDNAEAEVYGPVSENQDGTDMNRGDKEAKDDESDNKRTKLEQESSARLSPMMTEDDENCKGEMENAGNKDIAKDEGGEQGGDDDDDENLASPKDDHTAVAPVAATAPTKTSNKQDVAVATTTTPTTARDFTLMDSRGSHPPSDRDLGPPSPRSASQFQSRNDGGRLQQTQDQRHPDFQSRQRGVPDHRSRGDAGGYRGAGGYRSAGGSDNPGHSREDDRGAGGGVRRGSDDNTGGFRGKPSQDRWTRHAPTRAGDEEDRLSGERSSHHERGSGGGDHHHHGSSNNPPHDRRGGERRSGSGENPRRGGEVEWRNNRGGGRGPSHRGDRRQQRN